MMAGRPKADVAFLNHNFLLQMAPPDYMFEEPLKYAGWSKTNIQCLRF